LVEEDAAEDDEEYASFVTLSIIVLFSWMREKREERGVACWERRRGRRNSQKIT